MSKRLSLINYEVVRELCERCGGERFHFVPPGAAPVPGVCKACGRESKLADMSDSSIFRLVTEPNGEMVIVPLIAKDGAHAEVSSDPCWTRETDERPVHNQIHDSRRS